MIFSIFATGTFTLPQDWPVNNTADKVECVGSGGTGGARASTSRGGGGGSGGSYGIASNVVISSNKTVTVGTAGGTTDTSFPGDSVTVVAPHGINASTFTGGTAPAAGTPSGFAGGAGQTVPTSTANGGGGGGAAGPSGAGSASSSATGGNADNGTVIGTTGAGASGTEWNVSDSAFGVISGVGAGGGGGTTGTAGGFLGGNYGGGGGGHFDGSTGTPATGTSGACFVTYTSRFVVNNNYNNKGAGASSMTVTLPSVAANDIIAVATIWCGGGTSCGSNSGANSITVADTLGVVYTVPAGITQTGNLYASSAASGIPATASGSTDTITITWANAVDFPTATVAQFSPDTGFIWSGVADGAVGTYSATSPLTLTSTTTASEDIVFSTAGFNATGIATSQTSLFFSSGTKTQSSFSFVTSPGSHSQTYTGAPSTNNGGSAIGLAMISAALRGGLMSLGVGE